MSDRVLFDVQDHVAHVRLNRPEKRNAIDDAMFAGLAEVGSALARNGDVRAVVLSGEGEAFCAGLDLMNFAGVMENGGAQTAIFDTLMARSYGDANIFQQAAMVWRTLPVPVVAALHGVALGGGLQIALGADMRYVHPETKLAIREIAWGLVPDMAGTQLLQGLVRDDILRELFYTGRNFSGMEAVSFGIATKLSDDPLAEAMAVAKDIAGKSPDAIESCKRLLNDAPYLSMAEGLMAESREQHRMMAGENFREAVMAGMSQRPPNFKNAR